MLHIEIIGPRIVDAGEIGIEIVHVAIGEKIVSGVADISGFHHRGSSGDVVFGHTGKLRHIARSATGWRGKTDAFRGIVAGALPAGSLADIVIDIEISFLTRFIVEKIIIVADDFAGLGTIAGNKPTDRFVEGLDGGLLQSSHNDAVDHDADFVQHGFDIDRWDGHPSIRRLSLNRRKSQANGKKDDEDNCRKGGS